MEQSLLRRDRQSELDIAVAEGQITKYLPVDEATPAVDFLFSNPACTRAITTYIWAVMEAAGVKKDTVASVTNSAARLCFSGTMRAHMFVNAAEAKK